MFNPELYLCRCFELNLQQIKPLVKIECFKIKQFISMRHFVVQKQIQKTGGIKMSMISQATIQAHQFGSC